MRDRIASKELSPSAANAIRMLLLTGARLNEVLTAKWQWMNTEGCLIEFPARKTGARPIFLSSAALSVLKVQKAYAESSEFILPGNGSKGRMVNLRKPWTRICERSGLQNVRLHDLRHTAASVAVSPQFYRLLIGAVTRRSGKPARM